MILARRLSIAWTRQHSVRWFSANTSRRVYDLTSDTATKPTDAMFDVMKTASQEDDVFAADASVNALEAKVAQLLGHEAALFCVSGCMTNQIGLRTLLQQPPHSVLCDAQSHVYLYECGGVAYHSQAGMTPVTPTNGRYLTADDVKANLVTDDLCGALTRVISLENTLNGTIMPLDEMQRIHSLARSHNIGLHLDGARLWNASVASGVSLAEYGQLFDTVSVCLSKGVGAPIGSILASSRERIKKARFLRKLMGGGWHQAGLLAAAAHHCIDTVVPTMAHTHKMAARLATHLEDLGMRLVVPCETNMVIVDTAPVTITELADALAPRGIVISRDLGTVTRIVLHYQIPDAVVEDVIRTARVLMEAKLKAGHTRPDTVSTKLAYPSQAQVDM